MKKPKPRFEIEVDNTRVPLYLCSPYHKEGWAVGIPPRSRTDSPSKCPKYLTIEKAQALLSLGFQKKYYVGPTKNRWPNKIWSFCHDENGNQFFEAKLSNQETGEYHGYPVSENEVPEQFSRQMQ